MDKEIQQRLKWVQLYEKSRDAGFVCLRCGISRPTLRKWWRRYQKEGLSGLQSQSKRPLHSPNTKLTDSHKRLIVSLRSDRNLGVRRIQSELLRQYEISYALATIHKVLKKYQVNPIRKLRKKSEFLRYTRPLPGDRVKMDTTKIAPGLYQYTSVDDCTRYRVLRLYPRRTATNTLDFIDNVLDEMPFPIQRIQTDRGREFFATKVQQKLMDLGIKFRPNKPGSPHLNGKVERSQKTDKTEFYPTVDLLDQRLEQLLAEWQHYYNWDRPHSAHHGKFPMDKYFELADET
jgi:transposase InsO family protein